MSAQILTNKEEIEFLEQMRFEAELAMLYSSLELKKYMARKESKQLQKEIDEYIENL